MAAIISVQPLETSYNNAGLGSAAGLISLLEEEDKRVVVYALKKLFSVVDYFWTEMADAVPLIEGFSEDTSFPDRELAAAVASRVYFHLEDIHDSLRLALGAGEYFDINSRSQYVETLVSKCIDEYTSKNQEAMKNGTEANIDPRLLHIVERMYQRCYEDGVYEQALGVALDSWNLVKVEEAIRMCPKPLSMLSYCSNIVHDVVLSKDFRKKVLQVLIKIYQSLDSPDYLKMTQILQYLNDAQSVAEILDRLIKRENDEDTLVAYQASFDLVETENQQFLLEIIKSLPTPPSEITKPEAGSAESKAASSDVPVTTISAASTVKPIIPLDTPVYWNKLGRLLSILQGDTSIEMHLHFLWSHNRSDLAILRKIKTLVEGRNSVTHHATVVTHGFMHAGTTVDTFLRENLTWLSKANNWAKFSSTASLGVVHKGHLKESKKLLQPYLPKEGGVTQSPYSEGGAVFALGLIHANKGAAHNGEILTYLRSTLQNTRDEVIQHGACLGIALAGMATGDAELYDEFKNIMYQEQAVAGEAAGLGIGILFLGRGASDTAGTAVAELLAYAHETKHEKIIRGVSLGVALISFGQENDADVIIEQMVRDKDPIIRYGGMFTIALAYVGSGSNSAIRRLLHVAVSDVSNDVRRAAVIAIGFVLFRTPDQVPRIVKLLSESYNPHVRYGACLAVGVACAGTASEEGIRLVAPMMQDNTDFVRQGAMLAMSMMLMQETATKSDHVKDLNEKLEKILGDKHQSTMTKMGAILASGIMNAGGRNVTIALQTRVGVKKMGSIVGMALGLQYWYWYPLIHMVSLSFTPTIAMGLNVDLQMPKDFKFNCDAAPSLYAYPDPIIEKKEQKKERVTTAVLSTTAKQKQKQRKKEGVEGMDIDEPQAGVTESKEEDVAKKAPKKKKPEPKSFKMSNPSRAIPSQIRHISTIADQRFVPVIKGINSGIILLRDSRPGEPADFVNLKAPLDKGEALEPEPPETFEWSP